MSSTVSVSVEIRAVAQEVFDMVADVTRMSEWSPEAGEAVWLGAADGPRVGAAFRGTNHHGSKSWSTRGRVLVAEPGSCFCFQVSAFGLKVSRWRFDIEPTDDGCRTTETWVDQRGALLRAISTGVTGVPDRVAHNRETMTATLASLKLAAEGGSEG